MARLGRPSITEEQRRRGEALGSHLKKRRTESFPALSEVDFAVQAGISVNTLRKVEGSTANPSFFVVDDLARTLGLDLNEVARVAREDQ